MQLNLNDEQMRSVVTAAILQTISPEQRDTLIQEALKSLLVPKQSDYYGTKKTPIQEAFERAAFQVAMRVAEGYFAENETVRAEMEGLVAEAWQKVVGEGRIRVVDRMADAIVVALSEK